MVAVSGPGWNLAPCLVALFTEADRRDPERDRASDGSIGNAEHAARTSDHNPADGWVCAGDIDDDDDEPSPGVHLLRQHLVASKDPRVKYLIHEGTIWKAYPNRGLPAWSPQVYTGLNAHKSHLHISVWNTPEARNDTGPWWPEEDVMQEADWNRLMEIVANVVGQKIDAAVADVKANADTLRDSLSALTRRVLGVELMANGDEQHKADADTGSRFQELLDGGDSSGAGG